MKIGQPFNKLTLKEYFFFIDNYKKYTDFNTLGLYRSILENENLSLEQKIELREYAHIIFRKSFDFLQLKDPSTYFNITTLGQELTQGDTNNILDQIKTNQQLILTDKKIKHRNFGIYSKHNCGYDDCPYNGLMIKQDSFLSEDNMQFHSDKNSYPSKQKSENRKKERKKEHQLIKKRIEEE